MITILLARRRILWAVRGAWKGFLLSSRRRHSRFDCYWSSDVCSSDLPQTAGARWRRRQPLDLRRVHGCPRDSAGRPDAAGSVRAVEQGAELSRVGNVRARAAGVTTPTALDALPTAGVVSAPRCAFAPLASAAWLRAGGARPPPPAPGTGDAPPDTSRAVPA